MLLLKQGEGHRNFKHMCPSAGPADMRAALQISSHSEES